MVTDSKILSFAAAAEVFETLKKEGKTVAQCHGTFDFIHPGHISLLEKAKSLADVLVVTAPAERFVNQGPGRPFFKDPLRAKTIAALACVDYVVMIPSSTAVEAIRRVQPRYYCLGRESAAGGPTIKHRLSPADDNALQEIGAETRYLGAKVYSSTKLLNQHFEHLPAAVKDFCHQLALDYSVKDFQDAVESFSSLKVLVVGDTIFDRYSYLHVQGLTSKNQIISGRYLKEETHSGGAHAAFRHVSQFVNHVKIVSLVGAEDWVEPILRESLSSGQDLVIRDPAFRSIVKQRFVEPLSEGKELSKLFSVNYLDSGPPKKETQRRLQEGVSDAMRKVDLVVLLDFGHGLLQPELRKSIQEAAPFLALNCQTNSNNHGFNVISRKYQGASTFSLDEKELLLSCGRREVNYADELNVLRRQLGAKYAWLTRGPVHTIGQQEGRDDCVCPPFENDVVDTIGAGDAFFSVAALAAICEVPVPLATFLGQLAGAQAVKIVGNSIHISKETLLRVGTSLLTF